MQKIISGIFISLMVGFGCTENTASPEYLSSFPMGNGTQWVYDLVTVMQEMEHEGSDKIIASDTLRAVFQVWIAKDTILNDSLPVKQFLSRVNNEAVVSENYYRIDKKGLWAIAYRNPGVSFFKKGTGSVAAPANYSLFGSSNKAMDNSLHIYNEPRLALQFPLNLGMEWNYLYDTTLVHLRIDKKVTGFEGIQRSTGNSLAFRIDYNYSLNESFKELEVKEWVSELGLIKRSEVLEGFYYTNEDGSFNRYGRIENTCTLRILEIKYKRTT